MALTDEHGMVMPVSPMYGGNGGFGGGFGGDWGWIILLLLFAGGFNGFGGGFGGGDIYPWMNQADITTSGFQNLATQNQITGIQGAIGDVQTSLCNGFAGVNATVNNGFANLEVANNARQIANMQQTFDLQSQLAQCCCDNRLATANLQSVIQAENCADRAAVSDGIRDILVSNSNNTQKILDMMCEDRLNRKDEKILDLQNQLNIATFNASQTAQNGYLQNALTAQTQYILSLYPPTAAAPAI